MNNTPFDRIASDCMAKKFDFPEQLAKQYGVSPHNIATAWVLAQSFPSLALVGPRSPGEIASTLPALGLKLSAKEVAWLNLEASNATFLLAIL